MEDWQKANPGRPEGEDGIRLIERMNGSHAPLRDWAFQYLDWREGMRILDAGCGGGMTLKDMADLSPGASLFGIDHSRDCARYASENCPGTEIITGDVSAMPYEDDVFDLVTAVETVYFWEDIEEAFGEVRRCLRKKGVFAVICEADGPERMDWENINFDIKAYRPREIEELMDRAGFAGIRSRVNGIGYMIVTGEK